MNLIYIHEYGRTVDQVVEWLSLFLGNGQEHERVILDKNQTRLALVLSNMLKHQPSLCS